MTRGRAPWLATRVVIVLFCALTAAYALVASSAFASIHFLRPRVFPWFSGFGDWQAVCSWPWLILLVVHVWPDRRRAGRAARVLVDGVVVAGAVWAGWNLLDPVLPRLADPWTSVGIGVAASLPPVLLAAVDHLCAAGRLHSNAATPSSRLRWTALDDRLFHACAVGAAVSSLCFAVLASLRLQSAIEPEVTLVTLAVAVFWSLLGHAVIFGGLFVALAILQRLGGPRFTTQHLVFTVALYASLGLAATRVVSSALGLTGASEVVAAAALAAIVTATWSGMGVTRLSAAAPHTPHGLDVYLGTTSGGSRSRRGIVLGIAGIGALAGAVVILASSVDWDGLLRDGGVVAVWVVVLGWAYRCAPSRPVGPRLIVCGSAIPLIAAVLVDTQLEPAPAVARYAAYDPAYRLAQAARRRPPHSSGFTAYLRAHTGLTDVPLGPIDLGPPPLGDAGRRPHVFLFVVDSLRPDYLAPYNDAVTFTPNIQAFASQSVVFTNAFTRYGGTGLSVPAIWTGVAMAHKQYVEPFHPMNALERLLVADGYRRLVSLDSVMAPLFEVSPSLEPLDRGIETMDLDLCTTLGELERRLSEPSTGAPVFAYSLPQNVHMSRLSRWASPPPGEYAGFFAPYADRVRAIDACFGRFIDGLRRLGLYDRSLIVLTSDHGELLGEYGQHGHSYHLFPQVVRVPLIVHLPVAPGPAPFVDPDAVALTTDITPTIYAVLGHAALDHPLAGRSLVGQGPAATAARRRGEHVLAASYGAVYAVLSRNGRRLYIVDGVREGEHLFERDGHGRWLERPPSADLRSIAHLAIRRHVDDVARAFRVPPRG